jgi:nucleoside-diphosphate-sugar epimerase
LLPRLQSGALGKFDLVLHMGACSATTEKDATYLVKNNYEFTKDLAAWSLANKVRFVYASSAATYGDGAQGMEDNETALDTLRPLNMYGYSKHLFDLHAKRAGILNKICGLKFFNVFGPNEDHKGDMRSLVHKSFAQVQSKGVIQLFKSYRKDYKDGEQKRDFLYVKDCVAMTLHLAATPRANGLFNIGSGQARTWLDLSQRRVHRAQKKAGHQVHRDAGSHPRQIPVFHPGEPAAAARRRLRRPGDVAGKRRLRLRPQISRAGQAARSRRRINLARLIPPLRLRVLALNSSRPVLAFKTPRPASARNAPGPAACRWPPA